MTDYLGYAVQGLFMGVGTATALWIFEKYFKPKLELGHQHIELIHKIIKGEQMKK